MTDQFNYAKWKADLDLLLDVLPQKDVAARLDDALYTALKATNEPTVTGWQLSTLADAYKERDPMRYVVYGLFPMPSVSIVYGAPGTLKSMLLAAMAVCVAAGQDWLTPLPGKKVRSRKVFQCPVLWLDFDNGKRRTDERISALGKGHEAPPEAPFHYVSMPTPWLDGSSFASVGELIDLCNELGVKLVVIDNLGTVSGGVDENSGEMIQVLANFRTLAEQTGAAVVIIHHQRKSHSGSGRAGDALRGHSSIEAALDLALLVTRENEHSPEVIIKSTKTRGVDVHPFKAVFTYDTYEDNSDLQVARFYGDITEKADKDADVKSAVKEVVRENPGINQTALVLKVRKSHPTLGVNRIRRVAKELVQAGDLREDDGPNQSKVYQLA